LKPTVETEVMGNQRVQMKEVLLWLDRCVFREGTRDFCSALAALVSTEQNIFSSPNTISIHLSPAPSKLGRQSCWVACLFVCVSEKNINIFSPCTFSLIKKFWAKSSFFNNNSRLKRRRFS
jgi:hypothetical protein